MKSILILLSVGFFAPLAQAIQTDGIRSFLTTPKPLESYLYEIKSSDSEPAVGTVVTTNSSGKVQYYVAHPTILRGCWNSESMNWAQKLTSTNISPDERFGAFMGRMNNLYWEAYDGHLTTYSSEFNTSNRTVMMIGAKAHDHACIILRLGLAHIDFPSAIWEGFAFKATARRSRLTPKERAYLVGGQIQDTGPGRFQIIVTNLESDAFDSRATLSYRGSDDAYPESIEILERLKYNDGSIRDRTQLVSIYNARQASGPLPPALFDPQNISELGRKLTTFYSNDVRYAISPHDSKDVYRMKTTAEALERARLAAKRQPSSIVFRSVLIALLVVPLALLGWRTVKRNRAT